MRELVFCFMLSVYLMIVIGSLFSCAQHFLRWIQKLLKVKETT